VASGAGGSPALTTMVNGVQAPIRQPVAVIPGRAESANPE
jgi:hypothetical protein